MPEQEPFKDELVPSGLRGQNTEIKQLKDSPEKLVRINPEQRRSIGEIVLRYSKGRELVYELRDYGIATPDFDIIIGRNGNEAKTAFVVVDKIEGTSLFEAPRRELEKFFLSMIKYFKDKYEKREPFLWDLKDEQFLYGRKKGDSQNHIYLVDTDPQFCEYSEKLEFGSTKFLDSLDNLDKMIKDAEVKYGGEKFEMVREKVKVLKSPKEK